MQSQPVFSMMVSGGYGWNVICMDRKSTRDPELLEVLSTWISNWLNGLESNLLAPTPHSAASWIQAEMYILSCIVCVDTVCVWCASVTGQN